MSQNTSVAALAQLFSQPASKANSSTMSLSKPNDPLVPQNVEKARNHKRRQKKNAKKMLAKKLPKGLVSIMNKLTVGNLDSCVAAFKELVIETIDHLEMTVDFILKRGLMEQDYAHRYISLCLHVNDIEVVCGDNTKKTFKMVMIDRCRAIHELNKTKESDIARKMVEINSCDDPEERRALQDEFAQYEMKIFKHPGGKSVFDDERPGRPLLDLMPVMMDLFSRYLENPMEYMCHQAEDFGIVENQFINLTAMFERLKEFSTSPHITLPPKLRFIILNILELEKTNWIPRRYFDRYVMAEEMFIENLYNLGYPYELLPLPPKDGLTDEQRNSRENESRWNKVINLCKNVIEEYEQTHDLDDVIYILMEDEKSLIYGQQFYFVKALVQASLELKPESQIEAGKLLARLLSVGVICILAVSLGIQDFLIEWDDYLKDYPLFKSYVATFIVPLVMSSTACFGFDDLREGISLGTTKTGILFMEILKTILSSKDMQDIKYGTGGILWIYKKWLESDCISLDMVIPINEIHTHYTNDSVGVFLVSIALYDEMKRIDSTEPLFEKMMHWINENINEDIIKSPQFSRAVAIASFIHCSKLESNSYTDFFKRDHIQLLTNFIQRTTVDSFQVYELEVLYGIQIIATALRFPGYDVIHALFRRFYVNKVISKEALELWNGDNDYKTGFEEDRITKYTAAIIMIPFFSRIAASESVSSSSSSSSSSSCDEEELVDPRG